MHIPATSITLFCTYQRGPDVSVMHLGGLLMGSQHVCWQCRVRGDRRRCAARVREVEVQLAGAQNSLKSERLLLQQASLVTSSWPLKTYPSPAPALTCLDANLALTSPVKREPDALPEHPSALATFRMCRLAVSWPHLAATDSQQMHLAKACKRT